DPPSISLSHEVRSAHGRKVDLRNETSEASELRGAHYVLVVIGLVAGSAMLWQASPTRSAWIVATHGKIPVNICGLASR
ncbi:hypothetical protein BKA82DRAFT_1001121, partial [Pisolithus tinctorius]